MGFIDAENWDTAAALIGHLDRNGQVLTGVYRPEKTRAAGPVILTPGDQDCSGCGTRIDADDYPGAAWANVLARQKLQYGHTMCQDCHQEVTSSG